MTIKKNDLGETASVDASNERRDVLKKLGIAAGAIVATSVARTAHAAPTATPAQQSAPSASAAGKLPMTTPIMDLGLTDAEKAQIPAKAYALTKADLIALFTPGNEQLSPAVKALSVGELEAVKGVFYRKWQVRVAAVKGGASPQGFSIGDIKCCCCPCCCATAVTQPATTVMVA